MINNKMANVFVVYHSLSQSSGDFENFLPRFDQVITDMKVIKPSDWYWGILIVGQILGGMAIFPQKKVLIWNQSPRLMGFTRLSQIAHILPQSSSCIDFIFIDQPNLVIDSGIHSSCIPIATTKKLIVILT